MPISSSSLNDRQQGDFYLGLSRLLKTGMPMEKTLSVLADNQNQTQTNLIEKTAALVSQGKPLSVAGRQAGLLRKSDFRLIQVGENAGSLVEVTQALATLYAAQADRNSKFRSRMVLPVVVLIIGLLLSPLPGLISGRLDMVGYLLRALIPIATLYVGAKLIINNYQNSRVSGVPSLLENLFVIFPSGKVLLRDLARLTFLENLGLYLQAGVDAERAFSWTPESIRQSTYQANFRLAKTKLQAGCNISDSLLAAGILDDAGDFPVISSGEAAGTLDESILHRAAWHREDIERRLDSIAEWAPRVIYAVVLTWIMVGFFS